MSAIEYTEQDILCASRAFAREPEERRQSAHELARRIASAYGVSVNAMLGNRRFKHLAAARAELYLALRAQGWSTPAIGEFCGGRDHTTVLSALKGRGPRQSERRSPSGVRLVRAREPGPKPKSVAEQQAAARAVVADEPWLRGGPGR